MKQFLSLKMPVLFLIFSIISVGGSCNDSVDLTKILQAIDDTHKCFSYFKKVEQDIRWYDTENTREQIKNKFGQPEACFGLMGFFFKLNKALKSNSLTQNTSDWYKLAAAVAPLQSLFCLHMSQLNEHGKEKILKLYRDKKPRVDIITFLDAVKKHGDVSWIFHDKKVIKAAHDEFRITIDTFKNWVKEAK